MDETIRNDINAQRVADLMAENYTLTTERDQLTARAAALPRWIPVEERLPDSFALNLMLVLDSFCYVGFWVETERVWFIDTPFPGDRIPVSPVTHWMPLPERPAALETAGKEGKEGQE